MKRLGVRKDEGKKMKVDYKIQQENRRLLE